MEDLPKTKHSLLPLLTFVFLVSYGLLTFLVVEQGRTIESQRGMIKELLSDSNELSARKLKTEPGQARPHSQSQSPTGKGTHNNSGRSNRDARRMPKLLPEKPPMPASDAIDERRAQVSI